MPFHCSILPTLTTVSIIGLLLLLTAKHADASKVAVQAPLPPPQAISTMQAGAASDPAEPPKSMALLMTSQPYMLAKPWP